MSPFTLRARFVLPMSGPPIEGGWVRIERGRIVAIGRRPPAGPVRDLGDAIILPGLVNAHTHLEFSDLDRPLPCDGGLPAWIGRVVALRRGRIASGDVEEARLATAVARGLAESAAAGVTAIGEIATALAPAAGGGGPRVRVYRETLGLAPDSAAAGRFAPASDIDRLTAAGRPVGISPHAPYSVCRTLGQRLIDMAVRRGLPLMMHLAESREEMELLAAGRGAMRLLLEQLGAWRSDAPPHLVSVADWISLLARADRAAVVHGTFLAEDPAAVARLSRHRDRICVVVCPRTTAALSGRLPPLGLFRSAGVRVAIGTDSRASTPDLSVLAECRAVVDAGLASPAETLAMVTRQGAWALACEHRIGLLAPGRSADLAILRPDRAGADPCGDAVDPATRVVAALRGGRVIAGRLG